jgi:phosphoesterase RecJ-like protein
MATELDEALGAVERLVRSGRRFLVTAHARPDGDALGSMLALGLGLEAAGKEIVLYNRDPAPTRLRFLRGADRVHTTPVKAPERFDATFVLDCGDVRLVGDGFPPPEVTGPVVVFDHHASARPFGDLVYREPSAAAVSVLVARLLRRLGVALDPAIGEAIWCSLTADTGWFRYASTDVESLELARDCVAAGVSPWAFARQSEEESPVARLRLLGLVLQTLELHGEPPRRVAVLRLDDKMLEAAGAAPELGEGFVSYARGLEGVEVGVLLTPTRHGVRVSLRSKGGLDVGVVAAQFDGGGHRPAAGCTIPGTVEEARDKLLAAIAVAPVAG